jgi:hypothetical protein
MKMAMKIDFELRHFNEVEGGPLKPGFGLSGAVAPIEFPTYAKSAP